MRQYISEMEKPALSLPFFRTASEPLDWETIFQDRLPALYKYFVYTLGDPIAAEELSATTLERAWRLRRRYRREQAGEATWLFGIARKVLLEHYRSLRKHSREEALNESLGDPQPALERLAEEEELKSRLRRAVQSLPDRERQVLALSYGAGLSHRQIGRILGLSESNVGTILQRTLARLRKNEGDHDGR